MNQRNEQAFVWDETHHKRKSRVTATLILPHHVDTNTIGAHVVAITLIVVFKKKGINKQEIEGTKEKASQQKFWFYKDLLFKYFFFVKMIK